MASDLEPDANYFRLWHDRLSRRKRQLEFVQDKVLAVLFLCGWGPLFANIVGVNLGEDPISGEVREYPIPPWVGVLSFTLLLIAIWVFAWQRRELRDEWHRLDVAAGWAKPSPEDHDDEPSPQTPSVGAAREGPVRSGTAKAHAGEIVRCGACGAKNRLSATGGAHSCGRCGANLIDEDDVVEAKPVIPKPPPEDARERAPLAEALANPVFQGGMSAVGLVATLVQTAAG